MYVLPPLPYAYDALEPYIDARTVEIHYTKHHATYVDNLNKAIDEYKGNPAIPESLKKASVEELLCSLDKLPADIRTSVRNNGGGHYAHSLFWKIMGKNTTNEPRGPLAEALTRDFGSFGDFQAEFTKRARTFFGSGWVWLCLSKDDKLVITSLSGHDTPFVDRSKPLMVLDVWEHAYYLKYQNRRADYIDAWWHVVNWDAVEANYRAAGNSTPPCPVTNEPAGVRDVVSTKTADSGCCRRRCTASRATRVPRGTRNSRSRSQAPS